MPVNINCRVGGEIPDIDFMKPYRPSMLFPTSGEIETALYIRLKLSAYIHPLAMPQNEVQFQVSTDAFFGDITFNLKMLSQSDSTVVMNNPDTDLPWLLPGTNYYARGRFFDIRGIASDWSQSVSFSTTADANTNAIIRPDMLTPQNNYTVPERNINVILSNPVTIGNANVDKVGAEISQTPLFASGDIIASKDDVDSTNLITFDDINLRGKEPPLYIRGWQKDSINGIVSPMTSAPTLWLRKHFQDYAIGIEYNAFGSLENNNYSRHSNHIDKYGMAVNIDNDYWNDNPLFKPNSVKEVDIGQGDNSLIKLYFIPEFWCKAETIEDILKVRHRLWVSPYKVDGSWYKHPAFALSSIGGIYMSNFLNTINTNPIYYINAIKDTEKGEPSLTRDNINNAIKNSAQAFGPNKISLNNIYSRSAINLLRIIRMADLNVEYTGGQIKFNDIELSSRVISQQSTYYYIFELMDSNSFVNVYDTGKVNNSNQNIFNIGYSLKSIDSDNTRFDALYSDEFKLMPSQLVSGIHTGFSEIIDNYLEILFLPKRQARDENSVIIEATKYDFVFPLYYAQNNESQLKSVLGVSNININGNYKYCGMNTTWSDIRVLAFRVIAY